VDLHPSPQELPRCVVAELGRDLWEDLRCSVDEHPALGFAAQTRVVAQGVADEVGELGERLDARIACADEDEGEVSRSLLCTGRGVCCLELPEHVVAERDRVGQVAEAVAVLGEAGHRQHAGDGAEREHEAVVADLDEAVDRLDDHRFPVGMDGRQPSNDELAVRAHHAQRDDDMPRLERPGRRFREERREEHEVLRADDGRAAAAEEPCDHRPGVPAAGDQRAAACVSVHRGTLAVAWVG
jgi:hypothetical protein